MEKEVEEKKVEETPKPEPIKPIEKLETPKGPKKIEIIINKGS